MNTNLTAPGQKNLTALQAKLHYLKIISELPSYGAKCFSTTLSVSISHHRTYETRVATHFLLITHQIRKQTKWQKRNKLFLLLICIYHDVSYISWKYPKKHSVWKIVTDTLRFFCESNVMHGMNGMWIPFCNIGNLHWCHKTACWMRTLQRVLPIIQRATRSLHQNYS